MVVVGEAGAAGGWTITPDARETVTSKVTVLVDCEGKLNGARGEGGFVSGLAEDGPAIAVF